MKPPLPHGQVTASLRIRRPRHICGIIVYSTTSALTRESDFQPPPGAPCLFSPQDFPDQIGLAHKAKLTPGRVSGCLWVGRLRSILAMLPYKALFAQTHNSLKNAPF